MGKIGGSGHSKLIALDISAALDAKVSSAQETDHRHAQDGAGSGYGIREDTTVFDCASGPLPAVEHSRTGPSVAQKRPFDLSRSFFTVAAGNSAGKMR